MDIRGLGNVCVVGLQWGDEGKGQIVDYLSGSFDVLVRYSGGANAGHTVTVGSTRLGLHLIPSGILHEDVLCIIANGVALDPEILLEEIDSLHARGVRIDDNLRISDRAHIVLPYHKLEDRLSEAALGESAKIGTTARGIGPCYSDKANRTNAIRLHHLLRPDVFAPRLKDIVKRKNQLLAALYSAQPLDADEICRTFSGYAERIAPFACDTADLLHRSLAAGKRVLFEGAQGSLLDVDHGTFPYVTSSNSGACGVCPGSGVPAHAIKTFLGVAKAYTTRVGGGAMPTELTDSVGQTIRERGREFGTTTGRPRRCGWFDGVATAYSVRLGGFNAVAIVGLNVLSDFDEVKLCVGYSVAGRPLDHFPSDPLVLEEARPVLESMKGWKRDVSGCRNWDDLPPEARGYLARVESVVGAPVVAVAVGPERSQLLFRPS
jgi:adenylosuccinate synthase